MSVILLLVDEDAMNSALLEALRLRNVDVFAVSEVGMLSRSDEEILDWAGKNNRVIYSFNTRDFYRLHTNLLTRGEAHNGIILGQQNYSVGEQLRRLMRILTSKSREEMRNQVEFLSAWGEM
jgi:predicted nuclease of predicted toxin-antitoxin system